MRPGQDQFPQVHTRKQWIYAAADSTEKTNFDAGEGELDCYTFTGCDAKRSKGGAEKARRDTPQKGLEFVEV